MWFHKFLDEVYDGNFSVVDSSPKNLSNGEGKELGEAFAVVVNDACVTSKTDEEKIKFIEKLISKIGNFSDETIDHYNILTGVTNRVAEGENDVGVRVLKKMVESKKFDIGAIFVSANGEKKDVLEAIVQQSVSPSSIADSASADENFDERNRRFLLMAEKEDRRNSYEANKAMAIAVLESGSIAGFEGDLGKEMAQRIRIGEVDFRALAGRKIPDRKVNFEYLRDDKIDDQSEERRSEDSIPSNYVEVKSSGSLISQLCSMLCCLGGHPSSFYQSARGR